METNDIPNKTASNWVPEPDLELRGAIGKLGEESAELAAICLRILIQGAYERDPDTDQINMEALRDEIADVQAMMAHVKRICSLDEGPILYRAARKYRFKEPWFQWLRDQWRGRP